MKKLRENLLKLITGIIITVVFVRCESDTFIDLPLENNSVQDNIELLQKQFDASHLNNELRLGEGNFNVNWNTASEVFFNKHDSVQKIEIQAGLKNNISIDSELFTDKSIYKLIITIEKSNDPLFNIIRYDTYKVSKNNNPSYENIAEYSGLKYVLTVKGKIDDIITFEKGNIIASFKNNLNKASHKEAVFCDYSSFFFDSSKCGAGGGSSSSGGSGGG